MRAIFIPICLVHYSHPEIHLIKATIPYKGYTLRGTYLSYRDTCVNLDGYCGMGMSFSSTFDNSSRQNPLWIDFYHKQELI